jgi:hypothetical protein
MNKMGDINELAIPESLRKLLESYYIHETKDVITADKILNDLHDRYPVKFPVSTKFYIDLEMAYNSKWYIKPIYDLLGITTLILSINTYERTVRYSILNNLYYKDPYKDRDYNYNRGKNLNYLNRIKTDTPDILILFTTSDDEHQVHNYLDKDGDLTTLEDALNKKYNELSKFKDKIVFNGYIYKLDSMIITNYNIKQMNNHVIAGITCNNERFVYNGWRRGHDINSRPCSLFKHNWSSYWTYSKGFCLPTANNGCELTRVNHNNLCFNFSKRNIRRIFFYVKHKK